MSATRRNFITGVGSAALGAGLMACAENGDQGAEEAQTQPAGPSATGKAENDITVETVAEAEKFLSVSFTPEEREQIVRTIGEQVSEARSRDNVAIPFTTAPATVFDPRLRPGQEDIGAAAGKGVKPAASYAELPQTDEDIAFAPLATLSGMIRARAITSLELTEIYLERLKRIGPTLECVVTLTEELARKQAARADAEIAAGNYRGPLHGIPWGAKDLLDTRGIKTTWGAAPFKNRIAESDATVVSLLERAGAVLVAKLTLGALAYGDIWYGGKTRNPWNPEEGSSGSSAGPGAATAAGLVAFSIGSETLGSINAPSLRCGTAGLRPTFGRVPRSGAMALCWSLDKLGPMTRTVEDAVLVLDAINAFDPGDPGSIAAPFGYDGTAGLDGLTLGYDPAWFDGDDITAVERNSLDAARAAGLSLKEITLPELPSDALFPVLYAEAAAAFEPLTRDDRDDSLVWQEDISWPNTFRRAHLLPAIDYIQGQRLRRMWMEALDDLFAGVDAMISPVRGPMLVVTNYTGHPSLALRAGFLRRVTRTGFGDTGGREAEPGETEYRVPHAVTLWGRLFDEGTLCRIGRALEAEFDIWHERPPLA